MLHLSRDYRRVLLAAVFSGLGDGMVDLGALPLLAASLSTRPLAVAAVVAVVKLPWLLIGLPAGAYVDRLDRRQVMVAADCARALVLATLVALLALGGLSLPLLYLAAFLMGCGRVFFDVAAAAVLPQVVSLEEMTSASSGLYGANVATAELAGPPLGGLLFGLARLAPFLIDALSFLASASLLRGVRGDYRTRAPRRHLLVEIGEGMQTLFAERQLIVIVALSAVISLCQGAALAVLVLYAHQRLGLGSFGYGLLLGVAAVGTMLGVPLSPRLAQRLGDRGALTGALALAALGLAVMALPTFAAVALGLAAVGFAILLWNVIAVATRARLVPVELMGRVTSSWRLFIWGASPLGGLLGGLGAAAWGLQAPFLIGAVVTGLAALALPLLSAAPTALDRAEGAS